MSKKELIIIAFSLFITLIIVASVSYAVFSGTDEATKETTIEAGTLELVFNDTDAGLGGKITLDDVLPKNRTEGLSSVPYKFKIVNNGTLPIAYDLKFLVDTVAADVANDLDPMGLPYIRYSIYPETVLRLYDPFEDTVRNNYIIDSVVIEAGATKEYELRVWVDNEIPNTELGKNFYGKIEIDSKLAENELISGPELNTLLQEKIISNSFSNIYAKTNTIPETIDVNNLSATQFDLSKRGDKSIIGEITGDVLNIYAEGEIISPQDASTMFMELSNVGYIDLSNINFKYTYNMQKMFNNTGGIYTDSVFIFNNTYNVKNMSYLFGYNSRESNGLSISGDYLNTDNVTNMEGIIANTRAYGIYVEEINFSNVEKLSKVFEPYAITEGIGFQNIILPKKADQVTKLDYPSPPSNVVNQFFSVRENLSFPLGINNLMEWEEYVRNCFGIYGGDIIPEA